MSPGIFLWQYSREIGDVDEGVIEGGEDSSTRFEVSVLLLDRNCMLIDVTRWCVENKSSVWVEWWRSACNLRSTEDKFT